ncbi:MAG: hypothetical protein K4H23_02960, partial [Mollicutes bacterium PWAP]|nr:hypothetical protein [Mollicutes bacterium PWAP]
MKKNNKKLIEWKNSNLKPFYRPNNFNILIEKKKMKLISNFCKLDKLQDVYIVLTTKNSEYIYSKLKNKKIITLEIKNLLANTETLLLKEFIKNNQKINFKFIVEGINSQIIYSLLDSNIEFKKYKLLSIMG